MKKYSLLTAVITAILIPFLLLLSSCANSPKEDFTVRVQSVDGDKYTAQIIFEVIRNDGKPLKEMDYGSVELKIDGKRCASNVTRLYGGEKSNNIAEFLLLENSETDISGRNAEIAIEDISADGTDFKGLWKTETLLDVDAESALYKIKPDAACNNGDVIFESVEVTPYSVAFKMRAKSNLSREAANAIGVAQENGEQRNSSATSSSWGEAIPKNGSWGSNFLQIWCRSPLEVDKITQLVVEDKAYPFSEIAVLEN